MLRKIRVPKMTIHFESLAEKERSPNVSASGKESDVAGRETSENVGTGGEKGGKERGGQAEKQRERGGEQQQTESHADKARNANLVREKEEKSHVEGNQGAAKSQEGEADREKNREMERKGGDDKGRAGPSLEEISKYRDTAQQNSMEVIRAAEERYQKAKESGDTAFQKVMESAGHGLGAAASYAAGMGEQAKDTVVHGAQATTHYVAEKGGAVKDSALEKGQQGYVAAKDTLVSTGKTAADYTSQTAEKAKGLVMPTEEGTGGQETGQKVGEVKEVVGEKAAGVKEKAVDVTNKVVGYTGEKVVAAKDMAMETGKSAAGYAGKAAVVVKEHAVVAGWEAARFTLEKAAVATETTAHAAQGVAGYVGEKAVAAKDVAADTGKSAAQYAGQKIAAAKDAIVSAEESAAEYAARKKEEAKREMEAKKFTESKSTGEGQGGHARGESRQEEGGAKPTEVIQDFFQGMQQQQPQTEKRGYEQQYQQEPGVLHAIGETIVEIAQNTKGLVIGGKEDENKGGFGSNLMGAKEHGQGK